MSAPLPDAEKLLAQLVAELRPLVKSSTAMVGIHTGGAWLAERLHAALGLEEALGSIDPAFYRDDYKQKGLATDPQRTQIPFEVEGKDLLLVDDILHTGRTVRAAVNEIFDYGRPASVALVVLADRGGRQLPIAAQHCGARVGVSAEMRLRLKRAADGKLSLALEAARAA